MSEWDALSATDKAYAIATARAIANIEAYNVKIQADELNRQRVKK